MEKDPREESLRSQLNAGLGWPVLPEIEHCPGYQWDPGMRTHLGGQHLSERQSH